MTPPLWQKVKRNQSLLTKVKEESDKVALKLNIQKTEIMASGPITSWQIDGETIETVTDFIFLGSKITADGECSHEIKRCLLLERKTMKNYERKTLSELTQMHSFLWLSNIPLCICTSLDSILKSRDITLLTKVYLVKAIIFPVVMYGGESWTIKKAEC